MRLGIEGVSRFFNINLIAAHASGKPAAAGFNLKRSWPAKVPVQRYRCGGATAASPPVDAPGGASVAAGKAVILGSSLVPGLAA